jgi:L-ribulose-5-phosphate 3-epimerase
MASTLDRREFMIGAAACLPLFGRRWRLAPCCRRERRTGDVFKISLAEWSLHRMLFAGELDNLAFPAFANETFGIDTVEYVNQFFKDKATDTAYLDELKKRCADSGVSSRLIMIDGEGRLGDPDDAARTRAVENHYKWVEAAGHLGCETIRVNAASEGSYEQQRELAADGLHRLCQFGAAHGINVIVENHGGLSSNGRWLSSVIKKVGMANCGTLPDFGNFRIGPGEEYDRYQGVCELMPYAKGVSAKSYQFDKAGDEVQTDFFRMMWIVAGAGYHGYVGIEWEGDQPGEVEGVRLTQRLLERIQEEMARQTASG